jgi:formylglycine-generating enzyme required for sulfatase activity
MKRCKNPGRSLLLISSACLPLAGTAAASASIAIVTVPVGNLGNSPDYNPGNGNYYGSVSYAYNIGQYDVTSDQYASFLNAVAASDPDGLYNSAMAGMNNGNPGIIQSGSSGHYVYTVSNARGSLPVSDVSYLDTMRFANWIDNGQPTGAEGTSTTDTGSYTITPTGINNNSITRNANAVWAVPTEAEWYKAAYYVPTLNNGSGGYNPYPTGSSATTPSMANYYYPPPTVGDTTPVGSYPYPTYYNTYDQGGNVFSWTQPQPGYGYADLRGGAFNSNDVGALHSTEFYTEPLTFTSNNTGFRVTEIGSAPVLTNIGTGSVVMHDPATGAIATVMSQLQAGYNNGNWNGTTGIISSAAAASTAHLTAVGAIINDTGANTGASTGNPICTSLDGTLTTDGDILIKYTWYGDANLTGRVDGSDYSLIDNGALNHLTGWYNGDFNYDGTVNGSDYTLIDNSYNTQGASLAGEVANSTAQIGGTSAVPEPGMIGLLSFGAMGLLDRRQARKKRADSGSSVRA